MERYRILLQFALDVAGTERLQIYYFTRGVDDRIASAIVSSGATTLHEILDRALAHETYLPKIWATCVFGRDMQSGQSSESTQRRKRAMERTDRSWRNDRREGGRRDETQGRQFRYGEPQSVHAITAAPVDQSKSQPQEYRQGPKSGDGQTVRLETRRCHRCGQKGHLRADCRTPLSTRQTSDQARERTHALAQPDGGATRQLIEGTLLIFGRHMHAMFDSGSTLSFLAGRIVGLLGLATQTIEPHLVLSTAAGDKIYPNRICRNMMIEVEGHQLPNGSSSIGVSRV
ncbi:hypothetical protein Syun_014099 [Stephania yunnanensis]|uniref:CCHC-type domain-containing protein n=1 Tax=Stephania yunnanensis TaxID=152371 RepID=A0AAP0P984_9MAGN